MANLKPFQVALAAAEKTANAKKREEDGLVFHDYPDYETYRCVQVDGNKSKLHMQYVKRSHIEALAIYLNENYGPVTFGLCHGTRKGREQKWFRRLLTGGPDIIGTEISDTAAQFPNTVQWDFHDQNPEWQEKADFVYSNSWDHAFDPAKAFQAWVQSLKPGGLLLLDHTKGQEPAAANALDPFGATYSALCDYLEAELAGQGSLLESIDQTGSRKYTARVVVFRKDR